MARETMVERLMREHEEANAFEAEVRDMPPEERLVAAAVRSIKSNGQDPVGKDGRVRLTITKVSAEGVMAGALREMGKIN